MNRIKKKRKIDHRLTVKQWVVFIILAIVVLFLNHGDEFIDTDSDDWWVSLWNSTEEVDKEITIKDVQIDFLCNKIGTPVWNSTSNETYISTNYTGFGMNCYLEDEYCLCVD